MTHNLIVSINPWILVAVLLYLLVGVTAALFMKLRIPKIEVGQAVFLIFAWPVVMLFALLISLCNYR